MGPMAIYATLAAKEAVIDAQLDNDFLQSGNIGAVVGSTTGSPLVYEEFYRNYLAEESIEQLTSGIFFKIMGHSCSANVCLALGLQGDQWSPTSACASSLQALELGFMLIKYGRAEAMICGGADEVHPTVTMVFDVVSAASVYNDAPTATPSPFDRDRDGVVCGGGSGILVLESLNSATARGATIYGEILGFGQATDSGHIANPHEKFMVAAMHKALRDANLTSHDIDYVNAHATGTLQGDLAEAMAIEEVFGRQCPASSLKGHFGHTLAAAGSLETIAVLQMLQSQKIMPTKNLRNPDPRININLVMEPQREKLTTVMKCNNALGGVNSVLVLRKWEN